MTYGYLSNGDAGYGLLEFLGSDTLLVDLVGELVLVDLVSQLTVKLTLLRMYLVRKPTYTLVTLVIGSAGTNEFDGEWIINPSNYWDDIDTHTSQVDVLQIWAVLTCANYDENATEDDGSCVYIPNLIAGNTRWSSFWSSCNHGIVTAVFEPSNSLAETLLCNPNGTGPYSAIWCLGEGVEVGDLVDVAGNVSEVYGLRQIQSSVATIVSSDNELPAAELLATNAVNDDHGKAYFFKC